MVLVWRAALKGTRSQSGLQELEFLAAGAADFDRYVKLAVGSQLPPGSRIWLEAPVVLLGARVPFETDGGDPRMGRVAISPHGRTALPPTRFPARSRAPCRLLVQMPLEHGAYDYEVYVSQLHEGFEVGRVTWRILLRR
ncbi:MAG TPA: hypothetical protein VNQ72_20790 [Candidatus Dormibacteraeota bacterium]|nr:hypothetical protein [Candidatus Dormibacteraeota bacterium]